ncbi:MAG TPA: PIN domain-containing protein, partial [Caldimonas sp.]|nr:PIN domain-containing protein [Caldimonas sp.]
MDIKALQLKLRRFAAELAQLADQTGIVLDVAPGKTHVLIDWENVQPNNADVRALVPEATDLWLFHGPNQKNVASHHGAFGERATPVRIARTGKNALDFHLSFYIGYIAARDPQARFVVISNDKGYGPMLDHARELGFAAEQVGFQKAKTRTPAKRGAAKKAAATKPVPAKKAPARKVVARKAAAKKAPAAKVAAARPPAKKAAA